MGTYGVEIKRLLFTHGLLSTLAVNRLLCGVKHDLCLASGVGLVRVQLGVERAWAHFVGVSWVGQLALGLLLHHQLI